MFSRIRLTYLALLAIGIVSTVAALAGASGGDPITTYEVRLTPNYVSPDDGVASNYQSVWVYPKSPTTPYRSPDSARQQSRYLLLDPRSQDSDGRVGQDEWWFVIERSWPSDFDPSRHGNWGRMVNFHNVAGDVGWNTGSGVSALALDWLSSAPAPQFTVEYHDGGRPHYLPTPARDTFHTYVVHFIAGRTDGTTVRPGALTVWADGSDSPAIDLRGINTLQRAGGATQKWMQLWEGDYTQGLPIAARSQFALTRVGTTLAEALADRPVAIGSTAPGQFYTGSGLNLGPPSATQITSRLTGETRIPPSLGGTATTIQSPPPTTTTPTTTTPTTTTPTTTTPTTTTPNPGRSNGKKKGQASETRLLSAAGPALLEWDGRLFHTAGDFRAYLVGKGIGWNRFVDTHPAAVSALGLPFVKWDGRTFFTQASLTRWLARRGADYRSWAMAHPRASAILAGKKGAGAAKVPSRTLTTVPIVIWDGIAFTNATGLRSHLIGKNVDWNTFLANHPSIAQKFGLA